LTRYRDLDIFLISVIFYSGFWGCSAW